MMPPVSAVRGAGDGSGGGGQEGGRRWRGGGHRRRLNLHKETFIDVLRF